ncbi:MAG: YqaA family protein [Caulobacterales bacterium]|uniref:YqaA family protein n=1 Tax=Glycocaulis sp. TaxID=1969725 RepID=UPI003FA0474C
MTRASRRPSPNAARRGLSRRVRLLRLRLIRAARGRWAVPALFAGSFIDSTIFPWPVALPLAAQMLRGRRHVFPAAAAAALGSILGGLLVYAAAHLAYEAIAPLIVDDSAAAESLAEMRARLEAGGAVAACLAMLTPVPVQFTSLAAGLAGVGAPWFALAILVGRGVRYFAMALVMYAIGDRIVAGWRVLPRWGRWVLLAGFAVLFAAMIAASF